MSTVVALPKSSDSAAWTDEEKAVIEAAGLVFKHTYGPKKGEKEHAPRAVVARFLHTCQRTGLDPLARQIYCIGRANGDGTVEWSIQGAIDGFRVTAERSQKYAGQDAAEWLTESGDWVPVFVKKLHGDHPLAARVRVYRNDWKDDKPAVGIATWDEYAQTKKSGDLTSMWAQRGAGQLAKCAEALALRKAFPQDLSGMYTDDEMQKHSNVVEVEAESSGQNWEALIDGAGSLAELEEISARIKEAGEGTDALRVKRAARLGVLQAAEGNTEDAEVVNDDGVSAERDGAEGSASAELSTSDASADGAADSRGEQSS